MDLADWTTEFVKAKNAVHRTLREHSREGDLLTFVHKHKTHHFLISPALSVPQAKDWYTIVCMNDERNLNFLLQHWDAFCQERLSVLFVNVEKNQFWQISPRTHSLIADPETLEQGVRTMASEVPTA